MLRDNAVRVVKERKLAPITFSVLCGIPLIEQLIVRNLQASGYQRDFESTILLLIDAPYGFAMRQLETIEQTNVRVIVTTTNARPEYWQDLLVWQPAVLLVGVCCDREIEDAIYHAANGERFHRTPKTESSLTWTERVVLRHVAQGWSNKQIARHLGKGEQTIANTLNAVYGKLQLSSRVAAALYYWGQPGSPE